MYSNNPFHSGSTELFQTRVASHLVLLQAFFSQFRNVEIIFNICTIRKELQQHLLHDVLKTHEGNLIEF